MGTVFLNRRTGEVWERTTRSRTPPYGSWEEWIEIGNIDHRYRPHYWGARKLKCRFCNQYFDGYAGKFVKDREILSVCERCNSFIYEHADIIFSDDHSGIAAASIEKLKQKYTTDLDLEPNPAAKFARAAWKDFAALRKNIQILSREWLWHLADVVEYIDEIRDIDDERKVALVRGRLFWDGMRYSATPVPSRWTGRIPRHPSDDVITYLAGVDETGRGFVHPVHPNCRTVESALAWATGLRKTQVKYMM